jgi:hypothetical protein
LVLTTTTAEIQPLWGKACAGEEGLLTAGPPFSQFLHWVGDKYALFPIPPSVVTPPLAWQNYMSHNPHYIHSLQSLTPVSEPLTPNSLSSSGHPLSKQTLSVEDVPSLLQPWLRKPPSGSLLPFNLPV